MQVPNRYGILVLDMSPLIFNIATWQSLHTYDVKQGKGWGEVVKRRERLGFSAVDANAGPSPKIGLTSGMNTRNLHQKTQSNF